MFRALRFIMLHKHFTRHTYLNIEKKHLIDVKCFHNFSKRNHMKIKIFSLEMCNLKKRDSVKLGAKYVNKIHFDLVQITFFPVFRYENLTRAQWNDRFLLDTIFTNILNQLWLSIEEAIDWILSTEKLSFN